jgi:hypothetical protein
MNRQERGEAMGDHALKRAMAREGKAAEEDRLMEAGLRGPLGNSATYETWRSQMHAIKGWSRPTFKRRLKGFKQRHPELTGARWQGDPYSLPTPPTAAMAELVTSLRAFDPGPRIVAEQNQAGPTGVRNQGQVGSARPMDFSGADLIAKARAHVKSAKVE